MRTRLLTLLVVLLGTTTGWAQTVVSTDRDLRAAVQINNVKIQLANDINLSNSTLNISDNRTVNIDLAGHTLNRGLTKREWNTGGQVITMRKGATLNLSNGTLKGGWGGDSKTTSMQIISSMASCSAPAGRMLAKVRRKTASGGRLKASRTA